VGDVTISLVGQEVGFEQGVIGAKAHSRIGERRRGRYPREEVRGTEYSADGRLMSVHRDIDRDQNIYEERVVDLQEGVVVRDVKERLTDHVGRGSAKLKNA
jgi:hypothetical protein